MQFLGSLAPLIRVSWAAAAIALVPSVARAAEPPTPTECSAAYEESQRLSNKGKLQGALEQLVVCAQPSCPQFLAKECSSDYELVSKRVPTIIVRVQDATGKPLTEARVSMDGAVMSNSLGGAALPVDPGIHEFTFEQQGFQPATLRVVVAEGQKNQPVVAKLETLPVASPPAAPPVPSKPKARPSSTGSKRIPTASYVLGALGIAGLATGTAFRLIGADSYNDLEARCGRACPPDDVDPVKTQFTVSSIGFGIGAAALVAAGVVLVVGSDPEPRTDVATARWSIRAVYAPGGGAALFEGALGN